MDIKDKKILAVVSGAFLSVLVFILFLTLQSRDNMLSNNVDYKGIRLGDACSWIEDDTEWRSSSSGCSEEAPTGSTEGDTYCQVIGQENSTSGCLGVSNGSISTAPCYQVRITHKSCPSLATLNCPPLTYNGESQTYASCTNCTINGALSLSSVSLSSVGPVVSQTITATANSGSLFANGTNTDTCEAGISALGTSEIVCSNNTYSGNPVTIASCTHCRITSENMASSGGSYTINASADSGYLFSNNLLRNTKTCTISAGDSGGSGSPSVTINCTNTTVGSTGTCTVSGGTIDSNTTISSSNTEVATISNHTSTVITYTAIAGGTSTISATVGGEVVTSNTFTVSATQTTGCSAGYYMGAQTCQSCESGYYCPDGISRTQCPDGRTSNIKAENENDCYSIATEEDCSITVSTASQHVSITSNGTLDSNSYYSVKVVVSGEHCGGKTLVYSVDHNGTASPNSETNVGSGGIYYFNVYPNIACDYSTARATLKDGDDVIATGTATISENDVYNDWIPTDGCYPVTETSGEPKGANDADEAGKDYYYSDLGTCTKNGVQITGYTKYWQRFGCGENNGGSSTSYCWKKLGSGTPNEYRDTSDDLSSSGWTKVGVTGTVTCGETAACYKKPDGSYINGKFSGQYDYYGITCPPEACYYNTSTGVYRWTDTPTYNETIVNSVDNEIICEGLNTTTPTSSCYYNASLDDYDWTDSPKEGYTPADINNPGACDKAESPACYVNIASGVYSWGLYESNVGYRKIDGVSDETLCGDACYKDSEGRYVWGMYANQDGYTPITSFKTQASCKNAIANVPKTASNVTMIIYISIIILGGFGIGFIAYSNYYKRQS